MARDTVEKSRGETGQPGRRATPRFLGRAGSHRPRAANAGRPGQHGERTRIAHIMPGAACDGSDRCHRTAKKAVVKTASAMLCACLAPSAVAVPGARRWQGGRAGEQAGRGKKPGKGGKVGWYSLFAAGGHRNSAMGDDDACVADGSRLAVGGSGRSAALGVRQALTGPGDAGWRLAVVVSKTLRGQIALVHALCAVLAGSAAVLVDTLGLALPAADAGAAGAERRAADDRGHDGWGRGEHVSQVTGL